MTEVRSINALRANRENNNTLLSPIEALEDAAADLREGIKIDKLIILGVNTEDRSYTTKYWCSNISASEAVALLETGKAIFLEYLLGRQ